MNDTVTLPIETPSTELEQTYTLPEDYIPKDQRKMVLVLGDDFRLNSGVATIIREMIKRTAHRYNFVCIGGAANHAEYGTIQDASADMSKEIGIPDAWVRIYPYNGYGDIHIVRHLMEQDKPDMVFMMTDPRSYIWFWNELEAEIRTKIPVFYYHVWDDVPPPHYNENFYRSCDHLAAISRLSYNVANIVWKKKPLPEPWQMSYIGHGTDLNNFYKLTTENDLAEFSMFRRQVLGEELDRKMRFAILFNSRNIGRKNIPNIVVAFQEFLQKLTPAQREECVLLLHTHPVDMNGTDIPALFRDIAPEVQHVFTPLLLHPRLMNFVYNMSDAVIQLSEAEGFGISGIEALASERLLIGNVLGGTQDYFGFKDENGNYLNTSHYNEKWLTNSDGRYKDHGEWVLPLFPNNITIIGSPPTPYINSSRADYHEAAEKIFEVYNMTPEERARRGALGRQYLIDEGFTAEHMGKRFIEEFESTMKNFKPRPKFVMEKA